MAAPVIFRIPTLTASHCLRLTPLILGFIAALALAACTPAPLAPAPYTSLHDSTTGGLPPIDAGTSLLVVSPHPDDETLCCGGVIQRVLAAGGHVSVVWITNGDGSRLSMLLVERSILPSHDKALDLANHRMHEARAATSLLGVPASSQLFLGYPDGGVSQLLTSNRNTLYHGKLTGDAMVPYSQALFPGHPYTGESLQHDFEAVLNQVQPTLVLAPSLEDAHPDHSATGQLTTDVLKLRGESSKLHYWIVHGGEGWPTPSGLMTGIPLSLPPTGGTPPNNPFPLSDPEVARKSQAIQTYQTQMQVMAPFLLSFARTTELFGTR
jgi:LmbE family N-acetylglucosaminyl deacetylase